MYDRDANSARLGVPNDQEARCSWSVLHKVPEKETSVAMTPNFQTKDYMHANEKTVIPRKTRRWMNASDQSHRSNREREREIEKEEPW
jgi:hypothetical protein